MSAVHVKQVSVLEECEPHISQFHNPHHSSVQEHKFARLLTNISMLTQAMKELYLGSSGPRMKLRLRLSSRTQGNANYIVSY